MSRRPSFPDEAALAAFSRRSFLTKTMTGAATVAGLLALGVPNPALAAPLNALAAGSVTHPSDDHDRELVLGHDLSTLQQLESGGQDVLRSWARAATGADCGASRRHLCA
jgi:hypothetical protein